MLDSTHSDAEDRPAGKMPQPGRAPHKAPGVLTVVVLSLAATAAAGSLSVPSLRSTLFSAASAAVDAAKERLAGDPVMAKPDPVRGVRVLAVSPAPASLAKSFTGTVAARYETAIGFRVGGKILKREVDVGQAVHAGDVLFALDPADYRAAVSAADAALLAAQAQATQAAADDRRQSQLLAQGWTTQAAYDRFKAAAQTAQNQARAAADRLELARNDLSYAELRAPHDGIVTAIRAEAGQVMPVGQPVLTLIRPGDREALVMVPEGQVADLREWAATASFWGRASGEEPAVLREIAPQADPASRTYAVRFSLPGSADTAELGSTVTVQLRRNAVSVASTLPSSAILFRDGKPVVWRLAPSADRVEAVPVTVERLGGETADVTGLQAGELIVTLGVHRLDEGIRVRVVEGPKPPQAAAATLSDARSQGGRS